MAYPSNYYTKAQEIIDKRRFDNSVTIERRTRELHREIPEIVDIDRKLSSTIDVLAKSYCQTALTLHRRLKTSRMKILNFRGK